MSYLISVVIPAYNEEDHIKRTLQSLTKQTIQTIFEVIVVDNASTDNTAEVVKSFSQKLNLKIIHEPKKGRGKARATGMKKAKGEILFCADADTIYPPNWLETGMKYFDNSKVVGVTGSWKAFGVKKSIKKNIERYQELGSVIPGKIIFGSPWLTGFNMAVRASSYKKSGGFNSKISAYEDIDLTLRIKKLGKIVYAKDFVAKTSARRFKKGMLHGLWQYNKLPLQRIILGEEKVMLEDKR